ncbi:NosD domain-containing protein, partial [Verrucomicrobiota bacterium]
GGGGDYTSITGALAELGPQRVMAYESIDVYDGTYEGQVSVVDRDYITIQAATGQAPVIDGTTYGVSLDSSRGITISGLRITGATSFGIYNNSWYSIIVSNRVYGNAGGIRQNDDMYYGTIRNNLIYNNTSYAIYVRDSSVDTQIINNTCYTNTLGISVLAANATVVIKNNISDSSINNDFYPNAGTFSYNCSGDETATGTGALTNTNPSFVNTASNDFHLKSGQGTWNGWRWTRYPSEHSPCIDAGDTNDLVGAEPSPNGGRINMGAYGGTAVASKTRVPGAVFTIW